MPPDSVGRAAWPERSGPPGSSLPARIGRNGSSLGAGKSRCNHDLPNLAASSVKPVAGLFSEYSHKIPERGLSPKSLDALFP